MGPMISPPGQRIGFVGQAVSAIAARVGTNAGVGQIYMVQTQPTYAAGSLTAMTLVPGTQTFDVYYPSSLTQTSGNGIDSGQYVWAEMDANGNIAVMPLDCN